MVHVCGCGRITVGFLQCPLPPPQVRLTVSVTYSHLKGYSAGARHKLFNEGKYSDLKIMMLEYAKFGILLILPEAFTKLVVFKEIPDA